MPSTLSLRCKCGAFRGVAYGLSPASGQRMVCYCYDCQTYAHFLGRASDLLDANRGTDIFPVRPSQLEITLGHENLNCLRLTEQGMFRWYTDCCHTPIANSMAWPKQPFAGLSPQILDFKASGTQPDEVLGPIRVRIQGKAGKPPLPAGTHLGVPLALIFRTMGYLLKGFWQRQNQPSPFFTPEGKPRARPHILAAAELAALKNTLPTRG